MTDIDLTKLSVAELQDLINKASDAKFYAENTARDEAVLRKQRIQESLSELATLLGPADAPAGTGSINAVLAFGPDVIKTNPGEAVYLALVGMKQLTETTLDLAKTISES